MFSKTAVKIAVNTVFQMIGKVVSTLITIAVTVIVTRSYGVEGYGEFSLMQSFPALFFIVVDFGFNAIAVRELSRDPKLSQKYFQNILSMRVLMSFVFMGILFVVLSMFPYSPDLRFGIRLSLFLILTQALYATTNIIFQSRLRYDLSTISYVFSSFIILAMVVVFSLQRKDTVWVNFSYVIGGAMQFVLNLLFLKKMGIKPSLGFDKELWSKLFKLSLPLGLMFVFSQINFKADAIMLSAMKLPSYIDLNNTEAVAVYALPYKVFEVCLVLPTFFMNSVYPVLVRHMVQGRGKLKATFSRSLGFLVACGVFVGLVGVLFAPLVIRLLGGSEFLQSVMVLRILLSFVVIFFVTQPLAWLIVTLEKQIWLPVIYLCSAIFNLSMNYVFIPKHAFYASSVITVCSELLILFMLIFAARRAWKLKYD